MHKEAVPMNEAKLFQNKNKEYSNGALACLGDSIIKFILTRHLFEKNGKAKSIKE